LPQGGKLTSSRPKEQAGEAMLEFLKLIIEQDTGRTELIEHINAITRSILLMQAGLVIWLAAVTARLFIHDHKKTKDAKKNDR